ncbi:MAG: uncharacterized protein KVP18_003893 [Porospora cf. gigantea A]|uniref:uncharacterized protein n=1 Tax=Porospora cf. gigantea A TaxID=2853593 RepID=UPI00355A9CFF|nr:MAG: hypothetical protein KVP18_003893 [Porospora cf. gigantea A]
MDFSPSDAPPLRLTPSHCYLACLDSWLDVADFKDTRNLVTSGPLTMLSRVLILASLSLRLSDHSVAVSLAPCAVLVWLHQTYLPALTCPPGSDWRSLSGSSVYGEELIGPLVALSHAAFTTEDVVAPVVLVTLVGSLGKAKELVQPLFRLLLSHSSSFLGRLGLLSLYLSGNLASSKMAQALGGDEHSLMLLRQMSVFRPVESYSVVARHASSTILSHLNDSLLALMPAVLAGEADPEPVLRRFLRSGATHCDSLGVLALCSVFLARELEPQLILRLKEQTDGGLTEEPLLSSTVTSLFAATESRSPFVRRYAYRILSGLLPLILRVFHSGDDAVLAILPSKDCLQPSFVETLRARETHPLCVDAARALMTDVLFLERQHLGRQKIQLQQGPSPLVKPLSLLMNPKKLQGDVSKISVACYGDLFLFSPLGPANQPQDKAKIWTRFAANLTKLLKDFRLPQGTSMMDQAFAETLVMEGFVPYVRRFLTSSGQEDPTLKDFLLQRLATQITVPLLLVSTAVCIVLQDAKWLLPTLQRELMGPATPVAFSCLAVLLREGLETCESWHAFRALLGLKGHFSSETAVAVQQLANMVAAEISDVPRLQNGSVHIYFYLIYSVHLHLL